VESGSTEDLVRVQKQEISNMTEDNNKLLQTILSKDNIITNLNNDLNDLKTTYSSAVTKVITIILSYLSYLS